MVFPIGTLARFSAYLKGVSVTEVTRTKMLDCKSVLNRGINIPKEICEMVLNILRIGKSI